MCVGGMPGGTAVGVSELAQDRYELNKRHHTH
jgi:hypothetical protein